MLADQVLQHKFLKAVSGAHCLCKSSALCSSSRSSLTHQMNHYLLSLSLVQLASSRLTIERVAIDETSAVFNLYLLEYFTCTRCRSVGDGRAAQWRCRWRCRYSAAGASATAAAAVGDSGRRLVAGGARRGLCGKPRAARAQWPVQPNLQGAFGEGTRMANNLLLLYSSSILQTRDWL